MASEKATEAVSSHVVHANESTVPDYADKRGQQGDEEVQQWTAQGSVVIDAATNRTLFWKVNRRVLVVMLITYFCQSLDKGTLNFSSIMGIQKDANLHGQQVSAMLEQKTCLLTLAVLVARDNLVHGHPGWRVSTKLLAPEAARRQIPCGQVCDQSLALHD